MLNTIPWEQRKLGEIVDVFDGTHQTPKYTDKGIMFLSVEDIKTLKSEKYISEEDFKKEFKYFPEIGDVLMTRIGDVGTTNVICSTQPIAYYVSLALLKNKNSDPYFLSTVISSGSVQSDIWKRTLHIAFPKKINKSEIEKVIIPLPSYVEQTQIGNFFKQLDDTIALHQGTLEKYQKLKISYLEKMFPKGNERYPELRFPNFTDAWEQRKLGDICNITTGKLDANAMVENGKYDFFTSGIKKYKIDHYAFLGPALTIAGNGATVGYMHYADGFFNAYQRTYVLTELLGDRTFLFSTINRTLQKKIQQEARAGNIPYIVLDMLTELDIYLPSLEEQTQIGNFFKQLDDTIALHQREFEKFKILRKAYLKHIFIDNTTQFRAEKTIPWEQCKLGDVVNIIMGQSPDSKNYTNNSSDHILVQGNADIKNGFVYPRVWTTQITKQGHSGDLIMSVRAPVGDIAKTEYDVVLGRGVCAIKGNEFIFQLLTKMKENDYWESLSTGSTFDSINSNDIKNAEIFIPSLEEQTQIGNFFKQLDDTIALHQKELAKYQQIKTACLEKMFVE